jgi:hypothetical protein
VPSRKKKSNGPFFERKEIVMIIETDSKKVQCDIFPGLRLFFQPSKIDLITVTWNMFGRDRKD